MGTVRERMVRRARKKFKDEGESLDQSLVDNLVIPAGKYGGKAGEAAGAGLASVISAGHSVIRDPGDSADSTGDSGGIGKIARKTAGKVFTKPKVDPAAARRAKGVAEQARGVPSGPPRVPHQKMAEIVRKFYASEPNLKPPGELNAGNIEEIFKEVARLVRAAKKAGK
jgi:hypothetical protein